MGTLYEPRKRLKIIKIIGICNVIRALTSIFKIYCFIKRKFIKCVFIACSMKEHPCIRKGSIYMVCRFLFLVDVRKGARYVCLFPFHEIVQ